MQRNSVALLSANIADTSVELHTESMKTFHLILETYANVDSSLKNLQWFQLRRSFDWFLDVHNWWKWESVVLEMD